MKIDIKNIKKIIPDDKYVLLVTIPSEISNDDYDDYANNVQKSFHDMNIDVIVMPDNIKATKLVKRTLIEEIKNET